MSNNHDFQKIYDDNAGLGGYHENYEDVTRVGMDSTRFQFTGLKGQRVQVKAIRYFETLAQANTDINTMEKIQEECTISDVLNGTSYKVLLLGVKGGVTSIGSVTIGGTIMTQRVNYILDLIRTDYWPSS